MVQRMPLDFMNNAPQNIVPENNLRLPDALTIKHGPARLLSRFVLEGDKAARRMGIQLRLRHDFDELLYVNQQYTVGLHEWWPTEDRVLLDFLFAHATQDSFTCRWRWAVGDVAFWDNRVVQHMAMGDVSGHRRAMHRTTVAGEAPA